jgi:hypothetical protein
MGFYKSPLSKELYVEGSNRPSFTCSVCGKKWINERAKLQCESWDNRPNTSSPE